MPCCACLTAAPVFSSQPRLLSPPPPLTLACSQPHLPPRPHPAAEATIAKRRSYANTISYLTPPAENAGLYKARLAGWLSWLLSGWLSWLCYSCAAALALPCSLRLLRVWETQASLRARAGCLSVHPLAAAHVLTRHAFAPPARHRLQGLKELKELISSYQSMRDSGRAVAICQTIIETARQCNLDKVRGRWEGWGGVRRGRVELE